jgi:molecular chaperone DnaK
MFSRFPSLKAKMKKLIAIVLTEHLRFVAIWFGVILPSGSEVEVTLKMDESRIMTVTAYIPILDEEFQAKIEMKRHQPNPDELKRDYEVEMKRFRDVKSKAAGTGGETAERLVAEVEASPLAQEVKEIIAAAKADPTAALQGEKRLLELKLKLDEATDALKWPSLVAESRDWLDYLKNVADQHGNNQQKQKAETLAAEVEEIIRERKTDRIQKRIDQIARLYYEIVMAQPGWWVDQFQHGKKQEAMSDQERAARLLNQGQDCLAKNNSRVCKMSSDNFGICCRMKRLKKQSEDLGQPSCTR